MRSCPECQNRLELVDGWDRSARERAGAALEVSVYRCTGCDVEYRHSVDERFGGDIHGWWRRASEAAPWELIAEEDWPTFGPPSPPSTLHLRHFEWSSPVLVFERESGAHRVVPRDELKRGTRFWQGWYVELGAGVVGLYASAEGPVFFKDHERTVLRREAASARLEPRGAQSLFCLEHGGEQLLRVTYAPPEQGFDSWSQDEAFVDFYAWLALGVAKTRWFDFYTIADPRDALWWDNDDGCAPPPRQ